MEFMNVAANCQPISHTGDKPKAARDGPEFSSLFLANLGRENSTTQIVDENPGSEPGGPTREDSESEAKPTNKKPDPEKLVFFAQVGNELRGVIETPDEAAGSSAPANVDPANANLQMAVPASEVTAGPIEEIESAIQATDPEAVDGSHPQNVASDPLKAAQIAPDETPLEMLQKPAMKTPERAEALVDAMKTTDGERAPEAPPKPDNPAPGISGNAVEREVEQARVSQVDKPHKGDSIANDHQATAQNQLQPEGMAVTGGAQARAANTQTGTLQLQSGDVVRQVAEMIASFDQAAGQSSIQLHLKPEELGQIHLRVVTNNSGTQVIIRAEQPGTADLLNNSLNNLKQSLMEAGVQLNGLSVGDGKGAGQSNFGEERRSPSPARRDSRYPNGADQDIQPAKAGGMRRVRSSQGVDYQI